MGSQTLTELFRGRYAFKAPRKYGGYFRKESDHRDFVSIGTAAGVLPCSPCCFSPVLTQPRRPQQASRMHFPSLWTSFR